MKKHTTSDKSSIDFKVNDAEQSELVKPPEGGLKRKC